MNTIGPSFQARWSDGRTAASRPATVRLNRAVEISPSDAATPVLWSLHRTLASVPLWPSSDHVLLRSTDHPGQSLLVDDPAFAPALLKLAPHLGAASKRWRDLRPGLAVSAVVALVVGGVMLLDLSPARYIAGFIPKSARVAAGQQVLDVFTQGNGYCSTASGDLALQALTAKLTAVADADTEFTVSVVNWDLVNAFALPGDQIVLTRGLIDKAQSPEEVAGVLAHEMGHGIELHPEAGMVRAIGMAAAAELVFTGSSGTIGGFGQQLLALNYSRSAEREADDHALRMLKAAQISPVPLAEFFDRLAQQSGETGESSGTAELFSTHPPSPGRAKLFKAAAATYETSPVMASTDWAALKSICANAPVDETIPQDVSPSDPNGQPPLPPT